ncbi:MAG: cyclophilin-like fold protein [Bryobacteraceae bacterium]
MIIFSVGEVDILAEFNDSETARRITQALPIESSGNYWGKEFYFEVPVKAPAAKDALEVVDPGTVAYWPQGRCLCLFWGPTPVSQAGECRAASAVNVVGKVLNPDMLPKLKQRRVRVSQD